MKCVAGTLVICYFSRTYKKIIILYNLPSKKESKTMDNEAYLQEKQEQLKTVLSPYQKELNRGQKLADFLKQCVNCASRDDFLRLDELLNSKVAKTLVEEEALAECEPLLDSLREDAREKVERYRLEFVEALVQRGEEAGLDIEIDFPRFSILKGIDGEIAFADRSTTINKKVMKSIDPRRIVAALGRLKKQLYDKPFDSQKYVESLFETYAKMCKNDNISMGSDVPILDFYLEYVIASQSKVFFSNMEKGKFRGYSLEQFSVDVWRCFESNCTATSKGMNFRLTPGRNYSLWLLDSTGEKKQIGSIFFQGSE